MNFEKKYEKYKKKYLMLKNMVGGGIDEPVLKTETDILIEKIQNIYNSFINQDITYKSNISILSRYLSYFDTLYRRKYHEGHNISVEEITDLLTKLIVLYFDLYSITPIDKMKDVNTDIVLLKNYLTNLGYNKNSTNEYDFMFGNITNYIYKVYKNRLKNRRNMAQIKNYLDLLLDRK